MTDIKRVLRSHQDQLTDHTAQLMALTAMVCALAHSSSNSTEVARQFERYLEHHYAALLPAAVSEETLAALRESAAVLRAALQHAAAPPPPG